MAKPRIGDSASLAKTISAEDVRMFADAVGDHNPVHFDEGAARATPFGRTVAHGMLGASVISAAIGTRLPGAGSIYVSQTLKFRAPVFPGDTVTATVTVTAVRDDRPLYTLETVCRNQDGKRVITGEAVVLWEAPPA
jgi:3-hydroxybutyryl-CoA dehydratase